MKPVFGYGKSRNDYGLGFYCTEDLTLAKEWAVTKDSNGYANCYSIETENLTCLDLNSEQYTILHWLSVLLENRIFDINTALAQEAKEYLLKNFSVPYNEYDIITGYRADDIGYPLVVRPSYVLGGRAMEVVYGEEDLKRYFAEAVKVSNKSPVLLDKFLDHATEIDVDAVADDKS